MIPQPPLRYIALHPRRTTTRNRTGIHHLKSGVLCQLELCLILKKKLDGRVGHPLPSLGYSVVKDPPPFPRDGLREALKRRKPNTLSGCPALSYLQVLPEVRGRAPPWDRRPCHSHVHGMRRSGYPWAVRQTDTRQRLSPLGV